MNCWTLRKSAQCIAAALAWLVLQNQDAVGLITFDRQIRDYVPPSNSPSRLNELLTVMEQGSGRQQDFHWEHLPAARPEANQARRGPGD
ncbi:MAG TPA: hypothetical protein VMM76_00615 [Pirellulaceae bacterium]|nr:hypothetical protein [Pirellulaceae bacterium]